MTSANPGTIGVVIVHYQRWPDVQDTVRDAIAAGLDPSLVVVVDNGSPGGAGEEFATLFPRSVWLAGHGNVGYAAAVNLGVAHVAARGAETALVLTHEVRFDPELPGRLHAAWSASPDIGVAAPRLRRLSDPDAVWSEGGDLNLLTCLPTGRATLGDGDPDWVDGCCFLVSTSDYRRLGGMYEPYFLYMEEVDFFTQVRRAGLRITIVRDAFALQEPGQMSLYHATRNRILLAYRVGGIASRVLVLGETVLRLVHGVVTRPVSGRSKQAERARALRAGLVAGRQARRARREPRLTRARS